jgi:MFS family permease
MDSTDSDRQPAARAGWYPWYVVSILAVAMAISAMDRSILALLIEPIKGDLKLTDFELSLLQGIAFMAFYSTMGLPLGYLADRWSRRNLITIGILLWSLATGVCGLARSFWQLFAGRLSVGFGEASLLPSAYSMLPDYFPPTQLPRALGLFQVGAFLGGGLAFGGGGLVIGMVSASGPIDVPFFGALAPWQVAFLAAAAPGPLVALLMLTVREPQRRVNKMVRREAVDDSGFGRFLASRALFFLGLIGAFAAQSIVANGLAAWTPSFFIRNFGWSASQIGIIYGCLILLTGSTGALLGGYIAALWTRMNKPGAPVRLLLWIIGLYTPCAVFYPLCPDPRLALVLLAGASLIIAASSTMGPTILQLATPEIYRGRAAAFYLFVMMLIGGALGPVAVAAVTDFVFHDPKRLNHAISVVAAVCCPIAFCFALLTYRQFIRVTVSAADAA